MAGKLNIKVVIEGIQLPVTVESPDEEKIYRDAAAAIQSRIQKLRDTYPKQPNSMYYAMAMLMTSVSATRLANTVDTQPYIDMMNDIEKEIEELGIK